MRVRKSKRESGSWKASWCGMMRHPDKNMVFGIQSSDVKSKMSETWGVVTQHGMEVGSMSHDRNSLHSACIVLIFYMPKRGLQSELMISAL